MKKLKLNIPDLIKHDGGFYKKLSGGYGECSGCEQTTPYGGCYIVNHKCVWIPEFGRSEEKESE